MLLQATNATSSLWGTGDALDDGDEVHLSANDRKRLQFEAQVCSNNGILKILNFNIFFVFF